jgi:hypothetical protein
MITASVVDEVTQIRSPKVSIAQWQTLRFAASAGGEPVLRARANVRSDQAFDLTFGTDVPSPRAGPGQRVPE